MRWLMADFLVISVNGLMYPNLEDWIFYRVIPDISVIFRESTLTISDSSPVDSPNRFHQSFGPLAMRYRAPVTPGWLRGERVGLMTWWL